MKKNNKLLALILVMVLALATGCGADNYLKDENGNIVFIDNAIQGGETKYFCEICHKELIIKATNSEKRRKHFAHKKGTSCTDNWSSHDISEWHLQWQEKFPKEYREVPVGDVNERHRADVNVLLSVVEFQHSPISYEDFVRRNRFYTEHHYEPKQTLHYPRYREMDDYCNFAFRFLG